MRNFMGFLYIYVIYIWIYQVLYRDFLWGKLGIQWGFEDFASQFMETPSPNLMEY